MPGVEVLGSLSGGFLAPNRVRMFEKFAQIFGEIGLENTRPGHLRASENEG